MGLRLDTSSVVAVAAGHEPVQSLRDRQLSRLIGVALFAYYLLILGGHHYSIDGIVMFEAAKRLFFHRSLVLDPPVVWGATVVTSGGWSLGMTLAYLPLLALWSPLFYAVPSLQETPFNPALPYNPALYSNLPYLLCSWLNPLITAATGSLVFRLARRLDLTPGWAMAAALAYGIASPAAAYARFDFAQPLAGLLLTAATWRLLAMSPTFPLRPLLSTGAILGFAFLTRPEFGVLIAWIVVWVVICARPLDLRAVLARVAVLTGPVAVGVGVYFAANWLKFGAASTTGYPPLARLFPGSPASTLRGMVGLLVSPEVGLLFFCPLAWLALPGLGRLSRERKPAGVLVTGISGIALLLYGSYRMWWAGASWGPRFLVPVVPLLVVASAYWAFRVTTGGRRGGRMLFLALGALGVVVTSTAILMDPLQYLVWIENTVGLQGRQSHASHFRLATSPLVSGASFLRIAPLDLPLVHLWRAGRSGAFLFWLVAMLGVAAGLAWTGHRVRELLRGSTAGNARTREAGSPPGEPARRRSSRARRHRASRGP
jgi:hypothetical protein